MFLFLSANQEPTDAHLLLKQLCSKDIQHYGYCLSAERHRTGMYDHSWSQMKCVQNFLANERSKIRQTTS